MTRPSRGDALLAGGLLVAMGAEQAVGRGLSWADLLYVPAFAALAWRRVAPVPSALVAIAFLGASEFAEALNTNAFMLFAAVVLAQFSLTLYAPSRQLRAGAAGAALLVVVVALRANFNDPQGESDATIASGAILFALLVLSAPPLALGYGVRRQGELRRQLEERAHELDSERELHAATAAATERERMAQDLHEIVADGVRSMLGELGEARRLAASDPDRAAAAVLSVEERGRDALTELRSLLGVLRRGDEDLELAPQPSLSRLDVLAGRAGHGIQVDLRVEGEPRTLTPGLDVAAFRVVEEALTHAAGARHAQILVRWSERDVLLEVAVDGPQLGDASALRAARERAALFGGRLDAGRRPRGGSAVAARLPLDGLVVAPAPVVPVGEPR